METIEGKLVRLEFYQELLLSVLNNTHPFYSLIIMKELSKTEVEEILALCESLNNEYLKQKEEGFVTFTPLLLHFAGMLNYKLDVKLTIRALKEQGYYQDFMSMLLKEIKKLN